MDIASKQLDSVLSATWSELGLLHMGTGGGETGTDSMADPI